MIKRFLLTCITSFLLTGCTEDVSKVINNYIKTGDIRVYCWISPNSRIPSMINEVKNYELLTDRVQVAGFDQVLKAGQCNVQGNISVILDNLSPSFKKQILDTKPTFKDWRYLIEFSKLTEDSLEWKDKNNEVVHSFWDRKEPQFVASLSDFAQFMKKRAADKGYYQLF